MTYDLIIVGASFAGLSLAHRLPHNLRILILDEKSSSKSPVKSTGLIRPKTRALLEEILPVHAYLSHSIRSLAVVNPDFSKHFFAKEKEPWLYATETTELVSRLLETLPNNVDLALGHRFKGMEVTSGDRPVMVEHQAGETSYQTSARFLVGADGAGSAVARAHRKLAQNQVYLSGIESIFAGELLLGDPKSTVVHLWLGEFCLGYGGWISPAIHDGQMAIKIGLASGKAQATQVLPKLKTLVNTLEEKGFIKRHKKHALLTFGNLIPVGGPLKPIYDRYTLLIGDAAGLCGAFAADGIQGALLSAKVASSQIPRLLSGQKDALSHFHKELESEWQFMSYLKRERRYRKLWDRFKTDASMNLLFDLIQNESASLLSRFASSGKNRKSLMTQFFKPRYAGHLWRIARSISLR